MKFSIIVVSLNAGQKLLTTVQSVMDQTYDDFEVIVKDGQSTDDSIASLGVLFAEHLNKKIFVHSMKDSSIYDAMNQAVAFANGDYYIFLNCGDLFENKRVLEKMNKYIQNGKKDIYYGDMKREGNSGIIPSPRKITDFVCYRNIPCHQVCFYKNTMFEIRGYDTKFPVRADYEHFLWCVYEKKARIVYAPVTVCLYEGNGFSETKEHVKLAETEHKVITARYIGKKCILYKLIMIVTLQPLRKKLAESSRFSYEYQKIKELIYGKAK